MILEAQLEIKNYLTPRANSVKDYLVENGVESARLSAVGFGETKPLILTKQELVERITEELKSI